MNTTVVNDKMLYEYFSSLINCFFKILPIRESEEESLYTYIDSLEHELLGCKSVCESVGYNPGIMKLISILRYLKDNKDCSVKTVKREVFKAIDICNLIRKEYSHSEHAEV